MRITQHKTGDIQIFFHSEKEKRNIRNLLSKFLKIDRFYNIEHIPKSNYVKDPKAPENYGKMILREKRENCT